ncbi:MAG: hypothetical protein R3A47_11925 [Polyangiales bacterium]
MHLTDEKRYILYLFGVMLAFMVVFFSGVSPDVMLHKGHHWENVAAEAEIKANLEEQAAAHGEHGTEHGAAPEGSAAH